MTASSAVGTPRSDLHVSRLSRHAKRRWRHSPTRKSPASLGRAGLSNLGVLGRRDTTLPTAPISQSPVSELGRLDRRIVARPSRFRRADQGGYGPKDSRYKRSYGD